MNSLDIQDRQTAAVQAMLQLSTRFALPHSQPAAARGFLYQAAAATSENRCEELLPAAAAAWKILVYDDRAKDLLAPLLTVGELRQQGVTLNLPVHSERSPVIEAPAVYLLAPTEENIQLLLQELQRKLYAFYFFNFTQTLSDDLMQLLARGAVEAGMVSQVVSVVDRYIDFVCLSPTDFSLNLPFVFSRLHSPSVTDAQVETVVEATAAGLLCVFATLGLVPIIKCPAAPSSPARLIARRLQEKILNLPAKMHAQVFAQGPNSSAGASMFLLNRPVLMLLDREIDLAVMVRHTWLYQPLIHDLLDFKLNRVRIPVQDSAADAQQTPGLVPPRVKTFHLESRDVFWREHSGAAFAEAALAVSEALADYNNQLQQISRQQQQQPGAEKAAAVVDGLVPVDDSAAASTAEILQAVSALPLLAEKKRALDTHTCIATALVDQIKARSLDVYYETEQQMEVERDAEVFEKTKKLLSKEAPGTAADKLRLLLTLFLIRQQKPSVPTQQLQQLEQLLQQEVGISSAALGFLRQLQSFRALQTPSPTAGVMTSSPGSNSSGTATAAAAAQAAATLSNKFFDRGRGLLLQGVRNLLPAKKVLAVTQLVETLMQNKEDSTFLYIDPRASDTQQQSMPPSQRGLSFRCGVAFIVGGGSFVEAAALREVAVRSQKQILYGSTDFVAPCDFVHELTCLGKGEDPTNTAA